MNKIINLTAPAPTNSSLSVEQKLIVHDACMKGAPLFDALVLCRFRGSDVDQLIHDSEVQEVYVRARAEGQQLIRKQLAVAAAMGNVSAMKALRVLDVPPDEEVVPRPPEKSAAQRAREADAYLRDLDARFARMKQLVEEGVD